MRLNQVTVPVLDIKRAIEFYTTLGLQLIVESLPDYARFVCPDGDATFSVHRVEEMPKGEGAWVYFERDDLDSYVQQLIECGIGFEVLPIDQPWLWREARLEDPDGNTIIIYYAGENRLNPPWRVG